MGKIAKYLNQLIVGNVFDNPDILEKYSTDQSVLKVKPKLVAFPESTDDIRKLLRFFNQLAAKDIKIPITVRGAGRNKNGSCLSNGLIISTEKLNKMLEIDTRERLVRVQSGITLRELNTALSVSGLTIPISGHDGDTIGGLIASSPIDESCHKYGGIKNYTSRIEVVLANGECLQTNRLKKYSIAKAATEKSFEGTIYRNISRLIRDSDDLIQKIDEHNLCGYHGIKFAPKRETLDLMPIFFGSEGTLGIISEVILRAVPIKEKPMRVVATFKDISQAISYMETIKPLNPRVLNLYDLEIIMKARETGKNLDGVIRKLENGYVVFASFDERGNGAMKKIANMRSKFPRTAKFIFETLENKSILNEFENSLVNYLGYVRNGERVPILTDFYLPARNIPNFLKDLDVLSTKLKLDISLFGSYANSIYSLRPKFDLTDKDFNKKATTFLKAGTYIINRQGGKLTGGTPEGRLKAVVTNSEILEDEQEIYNDIKNIFDKNHILNPDIKLQANSRFTLTHFRNTNHPKVML